MRPLTVLCIASYEKGYEFLREAKRQGCRVLLLTSHSLKETAKWPLESINEIYYMPDNKQQWDRQQTINAVSYLSRTEALDLFCFVRNELIVTKAQAALFSHDFVEFRVPCRGFATEPAAKGAKALAQALITIVGQLRRD